MNIKAFFSETVRDLPGGSPGAALCFFVLFLLGLSTFWLDRHLPLVDLPQHAAQIAALRDIFSGQFKWHHLVEINWLTPYLIVPVISAVMALVLPIHLVFSINLSLAYALYVAVFLLLRRKLGANPVFDFVSLIGFFGFSYSWGFYIYLMSVPFGMLFILLALDYSRTPRQGGVKLLASGIVLFFMHGLVFVFAGLVGGALLLRAHFPRSKEDAAHFLLCCWPYFVLAYMVIAYSLSLPHHPEVFYPNKWDAGLFRLISIVFCLAQDVHPYFTGIRLLVVSGMTSSVRLFAIVVVLLCLLLHLRHVSRIKPEALVLLVVTLLVIFLYPSRFTLISYIYERHHIYLLPFMALATLPAAHLVPIWRTRMTVAILVIACGAFITANISTILTFKEENRFYQDVMNVMEPGQTALTLNFDNTSPSGVARYVYLHIPLWYQAERGGWVDYNFASNYQQIIRYPLGTYKTMPINEGWAPEYFQWGTMQARQYRYFIIHAGEFEQESRFAQLLANDECEVTHVLTKGRWRLYERKICRD